jgi:putative CocE/NonD family hydrolase
LSAASWLLSRASRLPRAATKIEVEKDIRATMPDGAVLLADRYHPLNEPKAPIVLIRTPYGRGTIAGVTGRVFAEQGYQCVIQSCRGTFGSEGSFAPFVHEAADGQATLEWLATQSWFGGEVVTYGGSYLGYTQWSAAGQPPPFLKALALQVTASTLRGVWYPADVFALDTALSWVYSVAHQEDKGLRVLRALVTQRKALAPAFARLPLNETDQAAVGDKVAFYQDYLANERADAPLWQDIDRTAAVPTLEAPVVMLAGWYDIFLVDQLADYATLVEHGHQPRLTIGSWTHTSPASMTTGLRESVELFDHVVRGRRSKRKQPVRIFVMGSKRWIDLPVWPPPATDTTWHLQPGGVLSTTEAESQSPDGFTYDPADPTPSLGGAVLSTNAGRRDNAKHESRADVLTYTTEPLTRDTTVIGPVTAHLHVRSSAEHTDFFVRLCDVTPRGKSLNVCDGLTRTVRPDTVRVDLSATAHCFKAGHRIRIQVSSGAHPRWARNLGTGEPIATAIAMKTARQEVFHDSTITLPVWEQS